MLGACLCLGVMHRATVGVVWPCYAPLPGCRPPSLDSGGRFQWVPRWCRFALTPSLVAPDKLYPGSVFSSSPCSPLPALYDRSRSLRPQPLAQLGFGSSVPPVPFGAQRSVSFPLVLGPSLQLSVLSPPLCLSLLLELLWVFFCQGRCFDIGILTVWVASAPASFVTSIAGCG